MTHLKLDELEVGKWYDVDAHNFTRAKWNGERFEGMREKFGHMTPDTELHWDTDPHYGTCKPITLSENQND